MFNFPMERKVTEKHETVRLTIEDVNRMLSNYFPAGQLAQTAGSNCPPPETLAEFVDGKKNQQRKSILIHLASCSDCYNIVTETIQINREWTAPAEVPQSSESKNIYWSWRIVRTAIMVAAAAWLVFAAQQRFTSSVPDTPEVLTKIQPDPEMPGQSSAPEELNTTIPAISPDDYVGRAAKYPAIGDSDPLSLSYSFSTGQSIGQSAFRTGVLLVQLEAAMAAKQMPIAQKTSALLAATLQNAGAEPRLVHSYELIAEASEASSFHNQRGKYGEVENVFEDLNVHTFLKFGEWLQCAILAEETGDRSLLEIHDLRRFQKELSKHSLPRGIELNLNEMAEMIEAQSSDRSRLTRLMRDTIELLWEH